MAQVTKLEDMERYVKSMGVQSLVPLVRAVSDVKCDHTEWGVKMWNTGAGNSEQMWRQREVRRSVWNSHCSWKFLLFPDALLSEHLGMLTPFDDALTTEHSTYKTTVLHQLNLSDDQSNGKKRKTGTFCITLISYPCWFISIFSDLNKVHTIGSVYFKKRRTQMLSLCVT